MARVGIFLLMDDISLGGGGGTGVVGLEGSRLEGGLGVFGGRVRVSDLPLVLDRVRSEVFFPGFGVNEILLVLCLVLILEYSSTSL